MLWGEYNYDEDIAAQRQEAFDDGARQKAIETAKNMIKDNIDLCIIQKYTGLPLPEVEQLAQEMQSVVTTD